VRFNQGGIRLDDLIGGTLNAGVVGVDRTSRGYFSTANAGVLTVSNPPSDVLTLDLGTVVLGDIILVSAKWDLTKTGAAGYCWSIVDKVSGTASIGFASTWPNLWSQDSIIASGQWMEGVSGIAEVLTAGTLVIRLSCGSIGSTADIPIGGVYLSALVLRA
jgi:hypothetical protein